MVNFLSDTKLLFGSSYRSQKICPEQSSAEETVRKLALGTEWTSTESQDWGHQGWGSGCSLAVSFQMNRCLGENTKKSKTMFC